MTSVIRSRRQVFRGGAELLAWDCPRGYAGRWCISADGRRPVTIPYRIAARAGAHLWRTLHGTFLHQGDGPRGWVQPL